MTMEQAAPYLLTPKDRVCRAQSVKYTEGTVRIEPERAYTLQYKEGGDKPYLILDLGRSSPGGYPVISVKAQKGEPVLPIRIGIPICWIGIIVKPAISCGAAASIWG